MSPARCLECGKVLEGELEELVCGPCQEVLDGNIQETD